MVDVPVAVQMEVQFWKSNEFDDINILRKEAHWVGDTATVLIHDWLTIEATIFLEMTTVGSTCAKFMTCQLLLKKMSYCYADFAIGA